MKGHYFPSESLIGGWYIPENVCDNLVQYFKDNSQKHESTLRYNEYDSDGFARSTKKVVRTKRTDLTIHPKNIDSCISDYRIWLQKCLMEYIKKYPMVNNVKGFNIFCDYILQYYKPGEGYFLDHFENDHRGINLNRVLVFMTYLNDVPDGGTNFKYQRFTTPAIKGLTVIWPAYFTHVHSGQITKEHEKYIITGWYTTDE
tara:strand:- start:762 stop:1364 length:603 start_codon:yes stop_codon:yes gene_type:complete